jgi:hypothetical protein
MADSDNQGQFGNREDTEIQAQKGGQVIGGNAENLTEEARRKGGKHSHGKKSE